MSPRGLVRGYIRLGQLESSECKASSLKYNLATDLSPADTKDGHNHDDHHEYKHVYNREYKRVYNHDYDDDQDSVSSFDTDSDSNHDDIHDYKHVYNHDYDYGSSSTSDSEDELPSSSHWASQPAPQHDPTLGTDEHGIPFRGPQGQNPWHTTNLWSRGKRKTLPPLRNVTIAFAKHMMATTGVPKGTSTEGQILIHRLLEIDRQRNDNNNNNNPGAASQSQSQAQSQSQPQPQPQPQPKAPLPPEQQIRLPATKMFPGSAPKGRPLLWTFAGKNPASQAGHFRKVQFQRMLYDDGVDADVIRGCKGNLELAMLWQWQRDRFHPLEGSPLEGSEVEGSEAEVEVEVSTSDFDVKSGDSDTRSEGVVDFDDMDIDVDVDAAIPTVEIDHTDVSSDANTNMNTNTTGPISMAAKYALQPLPYLTTPPRPNSNSNPQSPSTPSPSQPPRNPPGRPKAPLHASPTSTLIALAARVNRYPLSLPGNNNGRPLTMQRQGGGPKPKPMWTTYRAKYSKAMIVQLLRDYDVLPAGGEHMAGDALCKHLVAERERLYAEGVALQEVWTSERLRGYVAEMEDGGMIPREGQMGEARSGNRDSNLETSGLLAGRHGDQTSAANGKRSWEGSGDEDSASDVPEPTAKKPRMLFQDPNSWLRAPLESSPVSGLGFKNGVSRAGMVSANDKENHMQEVGHTSSEFDCNGGYMNRSCYGGQDGDDLIDPRLL